MRMISFLLLSVVFCCCYASNDTLILFENVDTSNKSSVKTVDDDSPFIEYKYVDSKNVRKKILLKNSKIELEVLVRGYEYVPKNNREKNVLEKGKKRQFFNDFNNLEVVTWDMKNMFCFEICVYDQKSLTASFRTNGYHFYDNKNKLMYRSEKNLLNKFWGVLEENHCR